jgi:hypothetical protein
MKALTEWSWCEVKLTIRMEIWNIDDRIIKDKSHRKRPQAEKVIMTTIEKFEKPQNLIGIMRILQNKYQDYSQLV